MQDLGKFDKASKAPIIKTTTTDVVIVAVLLAVMFIVSGATAKRYYDDLSVANQEASASWVK